MTVLITLTIAGADSGPFDLYSDLDGYVTPFETGVSKIALLAGYSSSIVPDYTNIIRIKSTGDCTNYIDITLSSTTTTTTSTTTVAPSFYAFDLSSPGRASAGLACAETEFTFTVYSDLYPLDFGHTVYTTNSLVTPVAGGDLWYLWGVEGTAYQINSSGVITDFNTCL